MQPRTGARALVSVLLGTLVVLAVLVAGSANLGPLAQSETSARGLGSAPANTPPASRVNGEFRLAIIRVFYADTYTRGFPIFDLSTPHTTAEIEAAAWEIRTYFRDLSYGQLDMSIGVFDAAMDKPASGYWSCTNAKNPIPCAGTAFEIGSAAELDGFNPADFDGVVVLSPCGVAFKNQDVTEGKKGLYFGLIGPSLFIANTLSWDFDCVETLGSAPGKSGVWWGGWAHEIGHQLELSDGIGLGRFWGGHPSGYASGYDLMDSCYPCGLSAYGLLTGSAMNGPRPVFPGWLPASKVQTVLTDTATIDLAPLGQDPSRTPRPQAIKIPIDPDAPDSYYLVEARTRVGADAVHLAPGIYDEGVHIQLIFEAGDPPVTNVNACDATVAGGCRYLDTDTRSCARSFTPTNPDYCWPFRLWHVGESYNRLSSDDVRIRITVVERISDDYRVTIERGRTEDADTPFRFRPHPDLYLEQNRKPLESPDIWVDSSCNGYFQEHYGSTIGIYRYGFNLIEGRADGNGDDACANHQNRLYARVRNRGGAAATDVRVTFK